MPGAELLALLQLHGSHQSPGGDLPGRELSFQTPLNPFFCCFSSWPGRLPAKLLANGSPLPSEQYHPTVLPAERGPFGEDRAGGAGRGAAGKDPQTQHTHCFISPGWCIGFILPGWRIGCILPSGCPERSLSLHPLTSAVACNCFSSWHELSAGPPTQAVPGDPPKKRRKEPSPTDTCRLCCSIREHLDTETTFTLS